MAKILLVDDEPVLVDLTKMILEKDGYEVLVAKNGGECLEELEKNRPDLILLDIMMPGESGWEVCRKIKEDEKTRDIPVVMFTVRTSKASIEKSLRYAHADAHLGKPFTLDELCSMVRRFL
ncbi:MAG: response regulator [Candidatus Hydrothermarchaeales archaeon]